MSAPQSFRELARGRSNQVPYRLAPIGELTLLTSDDEVGETVAAYVQQRVMPRDPNGDAMHLALASHYGCDALVTWNFKHLANPYKLDRIRRLNEALGLSVPRIVTPEDLLEEGL